MSTTSSGVQYYQTTLRNWCGASDGFASSIWPMGTNVNFHNTGTSTGGDFGELNKLNYDNAIELYTPGLNTGSAGRDCDFNFGSSWRYAVSCSYLSSSNVITGSATGSCLSDCIPDKSQVIKFSYDPLATNESWGNPTIFTGSQALYLPANKEFSVEFEFDSHIGPQGSTFAADQSQLLIALVPSGTNYMDSEDFDMNIGGVGSVTRLSASLGLMVGSVGIGITTEAPSTDPSVHQFPSTYVAWTSSLGSSGPIFPLLTGTVIPLGPPNYGTPTLEVRRRWKIARKFGPTLTDPRNNVWSYEWSYQSDLNSNCWQPFAAIDAGSDSFATGSYYVVLDFANDVNESGLTASCLAPSIQSYHTKSWHRSRYTSKPTASITYCYPGGFLTNDFPDDHYGYTWFPEDLSNPGANKPYKDYGLMWNVADDRERVLGEKRYPFYESYEDYSWDIRTMGKNYSIIPEFNISKQVEHLIRNPNVKTDFGFLTLDGASITSSGEGWYEPGPANQGKGRGLNEEFYKNYSNSDYETDLDYIVNQHVGATALPLDCEMKYFSISCDAILKLLPYEGFYPITRTTQLANIFSGSVDTSNSVDGYNVELLQYNNNNQCWDEIKSCAKRFDPATPSVILPDPSINYHQYPALQGVRTQAITTPLFHPGMLYNSIKSGISVGWTIVTSSNISDVYRSFDVSHPGGLYGDWYDSGSVLQHLFLNTVLYQNPDLATKIPFEATYDLSAFPKADSTRTGGGFHVNYPEALQGLSTTCASGAFSVNNNYMVRMKQIPKEPLYEMAMNNFLSEVVRFFLRDRGSIDAQAGNLGELTTFKTVTPGQIVSRGRDVPQVGATYYMDVILECVPEEFTMCKSYWGRNGENENKYYKQFPASGSFGEMQLSPGPPPTDGDASYIPFSPFEPDPEFAVGAVVNFSCSFDGRYFGPATQKYKEYWYPQSPVFGAHYNVCDPAQAPYAPPYYYGSSRVTLEYKAGTEWQPQNLNSNVWSVVFSKLTASYYNPQLEARIEEGGLNTALGVPEFNKDCFAYAMAQNVADSLNLFGTTNEGAINARDDVIPDRGMITEYSSVYSPDSTRWVIAPKWECPVLDFNTQPSGTITIAGGLMPTCSFSASTIFASIDAGGRPAFLNNIPVGIGTGMWSGYGQHKETEGVRIRLDETPGLQNSEAINTFEGEQVYNNSLLKLAGFNEGSGGDLTRYIGTLAPERTLSEAIVAIPFIQNTIADTDGKFAPTTNMGDSYSECFGQDRFFFTIEPNVIFENGTRNLREDRLSQKILITSPVVKQMVERMKKFVLPPQLDFVKNNNLKPIVMYIMPLSVKLSQRDLQDIWQGVLPGPGVTANPPDSTTHASITHDLASAFYQGKVIPPDIRWMVFKVKERGESDYSKVTTTMTDEIASNISARGIIEPRKDTYNWPYDFCSLIELAKIETSFSIRPKPPSPPPPAAAVTPPKAPAASGEKTFPPAPAAGSKDLTPTGPSVKFSTRGEIKSREGWSPGDEEE